jgi:hypothetical protein
MTLKIDWATHEAAKYACENWHYSKCMPAGKIVKIGVWEENKFIGVVLFSRGACNNLLTPYGLTTIEGCELTRIALNKHKNHVSKILSIAIKYLKKKCEGLKIIVSFADPRQNHHGGIYQATNWIYIGLSQIGGTLEYYINGKWTHHRSVGAKFGQAGFKFAQKNNIKTRKPTKKHIYLMPLTDDIKTKILKLAKPYPKRVSSFDSEVVAFQAAEGSASLTDTLQSKNQNTNRNDVIEESYV